MTTMLSVSPRTLIEGCFDADGTAALSTVYDLGLALGLPEQNVRLTIRRMQSAGLLHQVGRGRGGTLVRDEEGARRENTALRLLDFAFAQDDGRHPWDGSWHLYAFSIPEGRRAERDGLRGTLTDLGAAALTPGLYVSPHDLASELSRELGDMVGTHLASATTTDLVVPGCQGDSAIAERLWPAARVIEGCAPLDDLLTRMQVEPPSDEIGVMAAALRLIEGLDHALRVDPLLPLELRPSPWPPRCTRADFIAVWNRLEAAAPDLPVFADPA